MPLDLRQRIKTLLDEQAAEAEEPASHALLRGRSEDQPEAPDSSVDEPDEQPVPEKQPIESPEATDTPRESIESPETSEPESVQIDAPEQPPEPQSVEITEPDRLPEPPPPEDRPVDDWEPPVDASVEEPEFADVPESGVTQQREDDLEWAELAQFEPPTFDDPQPDVMGLMNDENGWQAALVDRANS